MNDSKSPLDRVVELFVYAPVGLALSARDLVPGLVERGRRQVDPQVGVARMVGQMAVSQGRSQAEKALEHAVASAQATLEQLGVLDHSEPSPGPAASSTPATSPPPPPPDGPIVAPAAPPVPRTGNGPAAAALAIPDYDSLSASQVLPRLSSLSNDELEAVRAYEQAHRGRKTILNKIAQLQGR
ncbi:MAG TPA: hypothetical protein VGV63_07280 [Acidimicrobiales bacterium]|nr:hypothetical protein [Acidimicrobiales bacterium]